MPRTPRTPRTTHTLLLAATLGVFLSTTTLAQRTPATPAARSTHPTTHTPAPTTHTPATRPAAAAPAALPRTNPLLPQPIPLDSLFIDLSLIQKAPTITPANFAPLYSPSDWQSFRSQFGTETDAITKLKSSAQTALAQKLIDASATASSPGLQRLLLLRAAAIAYRNKDGYPTADKAVAAYLSLMDKSSPAQVGALWTIANQISRMAVTPKPDRIRYDAVAAKANMQLSLLLLDADQIGAAQAMIKMVAYHEGWLKSDPATRATIAQVRNRVTQAAKLMDFLATQYDPAVHNDPSALLMVYLYGRYVKGNPAIVSDLPPRVPNSPLAQLATSLDLAAHDPTASFAAAENLRTVAATLPDGTGALIRQRTLYAALENYRTFLATPATERDRIHRTLARMSMESVIADGARKAIPIDPFAAPPTTQPGVTPAPQPTQPQPRAVGLAQSR